MYIHGTYCGPIVSLQGKTALLKFDLGYWERPPCWEAQFDELGLCSDGVVRIEPEELPEGVKVLSHNWHEFAYGDFK